MKRLVLIGLLAACLLVPAANAHVVIAHDPDGDGVCQYTIIGRPNLAPHASAWTDGCGPIYHVGTTLP